MASGSTGHLLYCDGQDEQVTLKTTKNHQTQGQCRISWDRKQSLLVDPIRAPTRDNATRLAGLVPENSGHSIPMHPALPAAQLTIVKGHRPHGIALDGHDKVASYVGKEAGPSRIGSDMHDPICFICFPCYRSIKKNRSNKLCAHVSMLPMIHVTMFQHCSATGGYHHQNQLLPI